MKVAIWFNRCAVLVACIIGLNWSAAHAQQAAPASGSAAGISLDVVGIKPGMTVREAMLALKADNPRLTIAPSTRQYEGFAEPLMPSVTGSEPATPGPNSVIQRAGENVEILFTMLPNQEVVWGVKRTYFFATAERPSLQNTLDALHKKYGPESMPPDPDPRNNTKAITWVYDGQGRPLGPRGAQLYRTCGSFSNHFGNGDLAAVNDIQTGGQPPAADCKSLIYVDASVQASIDPASSQFVVNTLTVILADGGRYRTAIDAMRTVILNAAKSREKKETDDVNKRGAPKL
jgi:hypothetical protein